jgi:hypothetical protein
MRGPFRVTLPEVTAACSRQSVREGDRPLGGARALLPFGPAVGTVTIPLDAALREVAPNPFR